MSSPLSPDKPVETPAAGSFLREAAATAAAAGLVVLFGASLLLLDRSFFWIDDAQSGALPTYCEIEPGLAIRRIAAAKPVHLARRRPGIRLRRRRLLPFADPQHSAGLRPQPHVAADLRCHRADPPGHSRRGGVSARPPARTAGRPRPAGDAGGFAQRLDHPVGGAELGRMPVQLCLAALVLVGPRSAQAFRGGWLRFAPAGIFLFLIITAGWPLTIAMAALLTMWVMLRTWADDRRRLWTLWPAAAAWLVGLGLSAPAWLMVFQFAPYSDRAHNGPLLLTSNTWVVPFDALPGLVLPNVVAQWFVFTLPRAHASSELAGGLVPVVVLAACLWHGGRAVLRALRWEWALAGLGLVLITCPSPAKLPHSFRWLPLFFLALGLLAAHALAWGAGPRRRGCAPEVPEPGRDRRVFARLHLGAGDADPSLSLHRSGGIRSDRRADCSRVVPHREPARTRLAASRLGALRRGDPFLLDGLLQLPHRDRRSPLADRGTSPPGGPPGPQRPLPERPHGGGLLRLRGVAGQRRAGGGSARSCIWAALRATPVSTS